MPELVAGARDLGDLGGGVDRVLDVMPGVGDVEARIVRRAIADDGEVERLEALERERDVEDRLHTRADHDEGEGGERAEVGGLVEGLLRVAMDAAEAARGEHPDAGAMGEVRRRRDRRPGAEPLDAAMTGRSRRLAFTTPSALESRSISAADSPTVGTPVDDADRRRRHAQGTRPDPLRRARPRALRGRGSPCVKIVDSSASTGRPPSTAACTAGATAMPRAITGAPSRWDDSNPTNPHAATPSCQGLCALVNPLPARRAAREGVPSGPSRPGNRGGLIAAPRKGTSHEHRSRNRYCSPSEPFWPSR